MVGWSRECSGRTPAQSLADFLLMSIHLCIHLFHSLPLTALRVRISVPQLDSFRPHGPPAAEDPSSQRSENQPAREKRPEGPNAEAMVWGAFGYTGRKAGGNISQPPAPAIPRATKSLSYLDSRRGEQSGGHAHLR